MPAKRTLEAYRCEQCGSTFYPFTSSIAKLFCSKRCMGAWNQSRPIEERFFSKLKKLPSGCWSIGSGGALAYPKLFIKGKQLHGHRISWMLHRGAIPDGMCVCHNCPGGDNRWCVNPDHLFLGTLADNSRDNVPKGKTRPGELTHTAVIKANDVYRIFRLRESGKTHPEIALAIGASVQIIKRVLRRETWKHLSP